MRYFHGDRREDLHNLNNPINKCKEWYWDKDDQNIAFLFETAVQGLKKLQSTYPNNSTIYIVFDHYVNCLKDNGTENDKPSNMSQQLENNTTNTYSGVASGTTSDNEIHKFLKELWSPNEIKLIIHMIKEFKDKNNKSTKEANIKYLNTINTITQTKEDELYDYIKNHSSIL
jgi:hypothetical protein